MDFTIKKQAEVVFTVLYEVVALLIYPDWFVYGKKYDDRRNVIP